MRHKQIKSRLLSILLTTAMLLSLIPVTVFADAPDISNAVMHADNVRIRVTVTEAVYGNSDGTGGVGPDDFIVCFSQNGGAVSNVTISGPRTLGNTDPVGGENTFNFYLTQTGGPASGVETIEIRPKDGASVYNAAGEAMTASATTGAVTLFDKRVEFAPSYPKAGSPLAAGSKQVQLAVKPLNETVTAYYVVVANGAGAPSTAQVMAGQDSVGGAALAAASTEADTAGDTTFTATLPADATDYDAYVVIKDGAGNTTSPVKVDIRTPDAAGGGSNVCQIDATGYATLDLALEAVVDGQTIKLLDNITDTDGISITDGRTFTIDLNGHTLNVSNSGALAKALEVTNGSEVGLDDSVSGSAFNVSGNCAYGVYADDATVTVSNAMVSNGVAVVAFNHANITVTGNAEGTNGGVHAENSCDITVYGDVESTGNGKNALYSGGSSVHVYGNVISSGGGSSHGILGSGNITVDGDVEGSQVGVSVSGSFSIITVGGNVTARGTDDVSATPFPFLCYGAEASQGEIEIGGNITASNCTGAFATGGGSVTVDGIITAATYTKFAFGATTVIKTIDDKALPTTKGGYHTYTDDNSTVWVKDTSSPTAYSARIAAGSGHSLFLKEDGTVWAWGGNLYGQLGRGTFTDYPYNVPAQVTGLSNVKSVAAGHVFSLALKNDGTVWAWGTNGNGRLGLPITTARSATPVQVSGLSGIQAISAGHSFSLALDANGDVWAWGDNDKGQLGQAPAEAIHTPGKVPGLSNIIAVSAGYMHSLALDSSGRVWTWGSNYFGELGNGNVDPTSVNPTPIQVTLPDGVMVTGIYAAFQNSMLITDTGAVYGWGYNSEGSLGDGTYIHRSVPTLTQYSGITALGGTGAFYTTLKSDGTVRASGSNDFGSEIINYGASPFLINELTNIISVSQGNGGNHALALDEDGNVWAWGSNSSEQCGIATFFGEPKKIDPPVRVQFPGGDISAASVTITPPAAGGTPQTTTQVQTATNHADYTVTELTWNETMTAGGKFKAGQAYTAMVTLTSKNGKKFQSAAFTPAVAGAASVGTTTTSGSSIGNTVTFMVTYSTTAPLTVAGISINSQPDDLEYADGDALSLSGLMATLTYNDGSTETIGYTNFSSKGITADPSHGMVLTAAAHHNQPVTVSCGSYSANTSNLTVTAAAQLVWQERAAPYLNEGVPVEWINYYDTCYGNGVHMAVGSYGTILTSSDGAGWLLDYGGADSSAPHLRSITYGNGMFVAVGSDYIYTKQSGEEWTSRRVESPAFNPVDFYDVAFSSNGSGGIFVAVGDKTLWWSEDGENWTEVLYSQRPDPTNGFFLSSVSTDGAGHFVAVGSRKTSSGTNSGYLIWKSDNGKNWTNVSSVFSNGILHGVAYGDGVFVTVGGSEGNAWISDNLGNSWTAGQDTGYSMSGITYGDGFFVSKAGNKVFVSEDQGDTWTLSLDTGDDSVASVSYGNHIFIATVGINFSQTHKTYHAGTGALETYTIAPIVNQTMTPLTAGYASGAQETKTVTVTRTGTGGITNLAVALSGTNASDFIITQPAITALNAGTPSTTFTVKAKDGLPAGNYTATATVTADNMTNVSFTVTQIVGAAPIVSATLSPATLTFDKNPVSQTDVSTTITWNDAASVTDVKKTGISVGTTAYTVSGDTLTIKKEYLATQPTGSLVLTVEFDRGNAATLTITVQDTTPPPDSSGGDRGDGGGSSTPAPAPAPKPAVQVIDSNGNISETITANLNSGTGTAAVTVDSASLSSAFDKSKADDNGVKTVQVDIPQIDGAKAYEAVLPASTLNAGEASKAVTIKTSIAAVTMSGNMLTTTNTTGVQNVSLTIAAGDKSKLDPAVQAQLGDRPILELSLKLDGQQTSWSNENAPVTVSMPYKPTPQELAAPESIVIWYIDGSGNAVSVPNGHYDPVTGTVTFTTTHFSYYAIGCNKVSFKDVAANAWYSKAVAFIAARGITTGTGNGNFSPETKLTRGQFIVMMMRAYGISPDANPKDNFSDAGSTYYTGYLATAKRLGISAGVGNNLFAPDEEMTHQEMFTLLYNALKAIGELPRGISGKPLPDFVNASDIAPWAKDAMVLLAETGNIGGSNGKLDPTDVTTRAHMAQGLYKLLSK